MGANKSIEWWDDWTDELDDKFGNGNGHGNSLAIEARRLLPTPVAAEVRKAPARQTVETKRQTGQVWLTNAVNTAAEAGQWGEYQPAIDAWAEAIGRPAPDALEPWRDLGRLSQRFVEWLMGLPAGYVTDVPGLTREQTSHALGNGVVPAQAVHALRLLLDREVRPVTTPTACENCGNDDASVTLALCLDCAESIPDVTDEVDL